MRPKDEYRACGGVVLDSRHRALLLERDVERDGRTVHEVRLPKGHVDPGESDERTALREVAEETGYVGLEILADLGERTSRFVREGKDTTRHMHVYLMRLRDETRVAPKPVKKEEALFHVLWAIDLATAEGMMTHDEERDFIGRARQWLTTHRAAGR